MIHIKEDVKKMADLLRSGYTMLNLACPICKNPIFRRKNEEPFCPICNRQVIIESQTNKNETINKQKDLGNIGNFKQSNRELDFLKEIIVEKMIWISQKLKEETQVDMIQKFTKILLNLNDLLWKFSNFEI